MNMLAYESDTDRNTFFKILIQLYLLCLFLDYLNDCIKEVIKGKIFWRLHEKVPANEAATS